MILRTTAMLVCLANPVWGGDAVALTQTDCPYAKEDIPAGYGAKCSSMAWTDATIDYRTTVVVLTPKGADADAMPIIYIPGGPGDAPVNKGADVTSILALFPGHTVITLNPRGVKGAEPRPVCNFDPDFWDEEIPPERENEIAANCRDAIDLDLSKLDAPYLAGDIINMVDALELKQAGLFGVSYGTESALHLLAKRPNWLGAVVLDSVSLPGALGSNERLKARDRFLGVIDQLCFAEKQCLPQVTDRFDTLTGWVAQFDENPLELTLGPHDTPWSLDGQDMLDFLSSLSSYPDGAGYGPVFIEALDDGPKETAQWVASEMGNGFEYAENNFALLYGAFSDSAERNADPLKAGETRYPFDIDETKAHRRLFNIWNNRGRTEERFITPETKQTPAGVPVLILSGGVDSMTPVAWAMELDRRFSGLTHFVFPKLAHAVAFGTDADVEDGSIAAQLRCGPNVVRAFIAKESYGSCEQFLRKASDE